MQYRSKEVVEAIQYTGSNEEEIVSFLKKNLNISEDYPTKIKKEDNLLKILFNGKFGKVEHFIANCEYYISFGMRHVDKLSKSNFEAHYSIVQPFPKEAYELVDGFVRENADDYGQEYREQVLTALEAVKKALGGE